MKTRTSPTKDRIVEGARVLFNEQGYGTVTTAALAAHLGMAEGNLWYHFKTKRALLEALGERFATAIDARLDMAPGPDPLASYVDLLRAMMAEFRHYRFLYRDKSGYGEHVDPIGERTAEWLQRTYVQQETHLAALVDAGLLDWPRERLRDLAINATIVLRYGLDHYRELGEPTGEGSGTVRRTLRRHLTLFEHRMTAQAAAQLHAAIDAIEETALAA